MTKDILVSNLGFIETNPFDDDILYTCYLSKGARISILDRVTGFGWRATETGFSDTNGGWWLANFDIREFQELKIHEAILKIKNDIN